jgi:2'-hydroxyisoflavone reductase
MKLLILGGTKFLGRYLVASALARSHEVTLFNRGLTNPDLFPNAERLRGNRDGDFLALKGGKWDAVIDTCGFTSRQVRATAQLLADSVSHYTFISSISVYRDVDQGPRDETFPLEQLPDGAVEDVADSETYGARKGRAEKAAEESMPNRVLTVRPGMIVGPHDPTGRFLYWVRRTSGQRELLAPAPPAAPLQLIDVRDLADWVIRMAEHRRTGIYNATGPAAPLTFEGMLQQCQMSGSSDAKVTWVDEKFLLKQNVKPWSDLPFWLPQAHQDHFKINCQRSLSSDLAFRPLHETVADIRAWDGTSPHNQAAGIDAQREQELLERWKARKVS